MILALLIAVALLPGVAAAQYGPSGAEPVYVFGGVSPVVFSFTAPAASAPTSLTPSVGNTFPCNRASTGTYQPSATTLATAAANTCRVDYRGLLVEESRTNLALNSAAIGGSSWTLAGPTYTGNFAVAPDGTTTASKLDFTASGASAETYQRFSASLTAGTVYTDSAMVWLGTGSGGLKISRTDTTTWTGSTVSPVLSITTTPARFSLAYTQTGTSSDFGLGGEGLTPYTATASAFLMWGAQMEAGGFATSYIPTAGTAVVRSADVIDEGARTLSATPSLSATVNLEGLPASGAAVALDATDGTNAWKLTVNPSGTVTCTYGAGTDTTVGTVTPGTATKIACSYDGATLKACVGGTCHGTAVALTPVSAFTHLYLGSDGAANYLNGFASTYCAGRSIGACPP